MCDFVSENIALNKFTWQLNPYENEEIADYLNSSKAVDGLKTNLSFSGYQCTISASMKWLFGAFILGTSSASITSPYIIEQTTWNGVNTIVVLLIYLYIYFLSCWYLVSHALNFCKLEDPIMRMLANFSDFLCTYQTWPY